MRVTVTAVAIMGVVVGLAAFLLLTLLHRSLVRNVDERLLLRLQDVATLAASGELPSRFAGQDEDGTIVQIVTAGRPVVQSPVVLSGERLATFAPARGRAVLHTVDNPPVRDASGPFRVAARQVLTPDGSVDVYAAASLEPVLDSLHALRLVLLGVGPVLLVVLGATTWLLVGRTLEPVEAIRRQVAAISATELARRVPEPGGKDEIHRLAETMNGMLARLDAAGSRQREFVSDAAHELRSPITAIRTELEATAAHPQGVDWLALIDRLARSGRRLERLVEALLQLAAGDEQGAVRSSDVDLDDIVLTTLQPLQLTSRLTFDVTGVTPVRVKGDQGALERLVANLVDNAERHAATRITVALRACEGTAELVVTDDGLGIPPDERERVFDRFARVDGARDRRHGGAGLGLAIARRIVTDHHGGIEVGSGDGSGTRMVVRLPLGWVG